LYIGTPFDKRIYKKSQQLMKNLQRICLLLLLTIGLGQVAIAQGKGKAKGNAKGKTEAQTPSGIQAGERYTFTYTNKTEGEQNMMGMNITTDVHVERQFTYKVLSADANGFKLSMKLVYVVSNNSNNQTGTESYDSRKPTAKPHDACRFDAWLIGKEWHVLLDKYGKATALEGYQPLYDAMVAEVSFKGPAAAVLKTTLTEEYKDKMMLNFATEAFGTFPTKAQSKGQTWSETPADDYVGVRKYTVTEYNDDMVEVTADRNVSPNPKAKPVRKPNGITTINQMTGTQQIVTQHQPKNKALLSRTITQNLNGKLILSGGPLGENPTEVDGSNKTTSTIKIVFPFDEDQD
jgi:hypothetical protein